MEIEIKIADNEITVERVISDGQDHRCEDHDHDIPKGMIYFIDPADVIMCEDHFWQTIKDLIIFES